MKNAIDNAKAKADIAAGAAGLKVIGVKSIIVGRANSSPPVPLYRAQTFADGATPSPTLILSGQQEVSTNVSIVYLIG